MLGNNATLAVFRRELSSYFATPIALVFIVIFLSMSATMTFYLGNLYERGHADLIPFFQFHPWLYLFLMPAISMRLWAEERKSGSLEMLMTLPITLVQAVSAKFLAAWVFAGLALTLTFPIWLTVNYLGDPDNGAIVTAYIGSFLMAGGFLAIGSCMSSITKNQVIAFIVTVVICFLFMLSDFPLVLSPLQGWLPNVLLDAVASLSFLNHYDSISRGVIDLRDIIYFALMIALWLFINVLTLDARKAE